ncbi:hypothetical protein [Aureimonas sp. AU12]|uniref:hypothetical protein n=1 Tax=Aureimonas sp. AU12 TaxID=1638161 RepID=UPI000785F1F9|nr:hypothetical protein [Aureimonas sp. AU12]
MAPIAAAIVPLFSSVGSALGIGGTAAAGAAGAAAGIGTLGSTIGSILAGTATLMSVSAANDAAKLDATNLELQAQDAIMETANETLQGVSRRSSIKRELMDSVGSQATAYAASGVDLSFGTPNQARTEAYRQADLGLETSTATERGRIARLEERASNLKTQAVSTRRAAKKTGAIAILQGASRIGLRG